MPIHSGYTPIQPIHNRNDSPLSDPGGSREKIDEKKSTPTSWRPFALQRRALLCAFPFPSTLLASLEIIYQYSNQRQGLATVSPGGYYLWTYGPTAILTLFGAFWSRAEYRAKQLASWARMARGPSPAESTLLLDYVSPSAPFVICNSLRHRDYLVSMSTTGSLLITLLVIISTGLLSMSTVTVQHQSMSLPTIDTLITRTTNLSTVGTIPLYIVQGVTYQNLSFPTGTTDQYAFQSLDLANRRNVSMLEVVVDGIATNLECERAGISGSSWNLTWQSDIAGSDFTSEQNMSIYTDSCYMKNPAGVLDTYLVNEQAINTSIPFGYFRSSTCTNMASKEHRIILKAGEIIQTVPTPPDYQPVSPTSTIYTGTANMTLIRSTQLMCRPVYTVPKIRVFMNQLEASQMDIINATIVPGTISRTLPGIDAWDLAQTQFGMFQDVSASETDAYATTQTSNFKFLDQQLALAFAGYSDLKLSTSLEPDVLQGESSRIYRMLCAQIAKRGLMTSADSQLEAKVSQEENRLIVRSISVRVMEVTSALLATLAILMVVATSTKSALPRDPGSIAGIAAIINTSKLIYASLEGWGASKLGDIGRYLSDRQYGTEYQGHGLVRSFQIRQVRQEPSKVVLSDPSSNAPLKYYRPWVLTLTARILASLVIVGVIAGFETCLHVSNHNDGLADVNTDGHFHYLWTFLPAAVMVSISVFSDSLDFSTKVFAPYARLKSTATFQQSLSINFLDRMAIPGLWSTLRKRHWVVFVAAMAMLIGSLLTIVVSGVFDVAYVQSTGSVLLQQNDWFQTVFEIESVTDASLVIGLVLEGNLSYPKWTYDDLVLPQMSINHDQAATVYANTSQWSTLKYRTPALRVVTNCTYFKAASLGASLTWGNTSSDSPLGFLKYQFPVCGPASGEVVVQPNKAFGSVGGSFSRSDCASYYYIWGSVSDRDIEHVAGIGCGEHLEQVDVEGTFTRPGFSIDPTMPPVPDEESRRYFNELPLAFPFNDLPSVTTANAFDPFFNALVYGRDGIPASDLSAVNSTTKVGDAIQHLHRVVWAQVINLKLRVPTTTNHTGNITDPIRGTVINPHRTRLVQNSISTRVLEAMLATMLLCIAASAFLIDTHQVLPKNPCNIAAVVSLLAGSKILDLLPTGAEWISDEELGAKSLLAQQLFRMGWFGGQEPGDRRKSTASAGTVGSVGGIEKRKFRIDVVGPDDVENATFATASAAPTTTTVGLQAREHNVHLGEDEVLLRH